MITNYNEADYKAIRAYLLLKGLNEYAIAGIVANLYVESKLRSNNLQNSYSKKLGLSDEEYTIAVDCGAYGNFITDRAGYGLCQWTSAGRKERLLNFIKNRGVSIGDRTAQLDFFWWELSNNYKNVINVLKHATSVDEATRIVMLKYERPANQSEKNQLTRVGYGMEFYEKYAKKESEVIPMLKIAIDAGHNLYTPGKRCMKKLDNNQTREWSLNDRIADKLEALLRSYNCEVLRLDDTTGKTDIDLEDRAKKANSWGADVIISIHHNGGVKGGSGGGTVVFWYSPKSEREIQARALYNAVIAETGLKGNRSKPVAKKGYKIIKTTKAPCFLLENGFMDSKTDVPIILSEDHAIKTARGLLNFLITTFGLKSKSVKVEETTPPAPVTPITPTTPSNVPFKVKIAVSKLNYRKGPGTSYEVRGIIEKGEVYTIVEVSGSWGKLKSGAGWICISDKYVTRL